MDTSNQSVHSPLSLSLSLFLKPSSVATVLLSLFPSSCPHSRCSLLSPAPAGFPPSSSAVPTSRDASPAVLPWFRPLPLLLSSTSFSRCYPDFSPHLSFASRRLPTSSSLYRAKPRGQIHRESDHVTARFFRFLQDGGKRKNYKPQDVTSR
jgi:hypothetical protein